MVKHIVTENGTNQAVFSSTVLSSPQ